MVISDCTVGMGITGSFCSFEKTKDVAKRLHTCDTCIFL